MFKGYFDDSIEFSSLVQIANFATTCSLCSSNLVHFSCLFPGPLDKFSYSSSKQLYNAQHHTYLVQNLVVTTRWHEHDLKLVQHSISKFWLNTCLLGCREHNLTLYLVQGMFYTTKDIINNSIDTYKVPDHMLFMLSPSMYVVVPISKVCISDA